MDSILVGIVLLGFGIVFLPKVGKASQYISTLFHEVGHVLSSFLTGGGASSIRIHMDTSGVAGTSHKVGFSGAFSRTVTLLSGYATPINLGAILVGLSFSPWVNVGVGILCVFSAVAVVLTRNLFGFLISGVFAAAMAALLFIPSPLTFQQVVLLFGTVIFLNGCRDILKIASHAFRSRVPEEEMSDFHILAAGSILPAKAWYVIFCLIEISFFVSLAALLISYR